MKIQLILVTMYNLIFSPYFTCVPGLDILMMGARISYVDGRVTLAASQLLTVLAGREITFIRQKQSSSLKTTQLGRGLGGGCTTHSWIASCVARNCGHHAMVQNTKNSPLIIHCTMSEGVSKMSENR